MKLSIQQAIDWIEGNLLDQVSLEEISNVIGYSPFHTSRQFKKYTNSTLKRYIMLRRLSNAAKELRDNNVRIIDIAIKYQYESQAAFTKAFKNVFGVAPGAYVKTVRPIPLVLKKDILFPDNLSKKGDIIMVKDSEIKMKLKTIPKHKFVYLHLDDVDNYIDFWNVMEKNGHDCDQLHGYLESIPGMYNEGYGAFLDDGYIFGTDAPLDYEIPQNLPFKERIIPKQENLVFEHPGFQEAEFGEALSQVRTVALQDFDFEMHNYKRDTSFVNAYEHSGMELLYYFVRIPLKSKH